MPVMDGICIDSNYIMNGPPDAETAFQKLDGELSASGQFISPEGHRVGYASAEGYYVEKSSDLWGDVITVSKDLGNGGLQPLFRLDRSSAAVYRFPLFGPADWKEWPFGETEGWEEMRVAPSMSADLLYSENAAFRAYGSLLGIEVFNSCSNPYRGPRHRMGPGNSL